jgi:enterochelin esterase-like enzyme
MTRPGWHEFAVGAPQLGTDLTVRVWSPAATTDRVLVAHDGPDYEAHTHLSGLLAAAGRTTPCHLVLLPPGDRFEWYAASPAYARSLSGEILPQVQEKLAARRPVVGLGASLGALAMLHCQRRHPEVFAGLFLQSGSFFQPRFDKQESGFPRWLRIVRFTGRVLRAPDGPAVPVTMTCGRAEENLANNRSMAEALRGQGYPVTFAENEGGHDWPAWRDALDPHLTALLRQAWA